MNWKKSVMLLMAGSVLHSATACIDPMSVYSSGVVFSKGEIIVTQNIERFCQDPAVYIRECEVPSIARGQSITVTTQKPEDSDPFSIDSSWVELNTLYMAVHYSGGCAEHQFRMVTDGMTTTSIPGSIDLVLTHNNNGDACESIVYDTLAFQLEGICECNGVELNILIAGTDERYTPRPMWQQVSGIKAPFCSYKLRSAYSRNAMAYIGVYKGFAGAAASTYKQLTIVFDTTDGVPAADVKVAALKAELERLQRMEVLTLNEALLTNIELQITATSGGQYWTAEDTILQFNQWFGSDGVNGVKGVYGTRGCGSGVAYTLPSKEVGPVASVVQPSPAASLSKFTVQVRPQGIDVTLPHSVNADELLLSDVQGRVAGRWAVAKGQRSVSIKRNQLSHGIYLLSVRDNGRVIQSQRVSHSARR